MERHGNLCKRFTLFKSVLKLELISICQNNITGINLAIFMNHFCHFPSYIFIVNMYTCNYGRHVKCYMFFVNILLIIFSFFKGINIDEMYQTSGSSVQAGTFWKPKQTVGVAPQALSCGQSQRRRSRPTTGTWARTAASRTAGQPRGRRGVQLYAQGVTPQLCTQELLRLQFL